MEEQQIVQCPYNLAHAILKHRMASHLIKCRKQHKFNGFSTCPYNSTHDVPTPELQYHIENCDDRRKLDSYLYTNGDEGTNNDIREESWNIDLPASNENWDEELCDSGSYLDVKKKVLENEPVFQMPVGLSKAQRKEFALQQTKKFGSLLNKNNA